MKLSILLAAVVAGVLSECAVGGLVPVSLRHGDGDLPDHAAPSRPVAPTQSAARLRDASPPIQTPSPLVLTLFVVPTTAAKQPTVFAVSASSEVSGALDFGDGSEVDFALETGISLTFGHTYSRSGTYAATFTAITPTGESASAPATVVVH
jgi:hypothetical protein